MSTSRTSVANGALVILGASTILDINEDSKNARTLKARYDEVRRSELRAHRWKFSIARAALPADAAAPNSDYARSFQMPNDCLRVIPGGDLWNFPDMTNQRTSPAAQFSIEGRKILSSLGAPLHIRYIRDEDDEGLWDASFVLSMSAMLGYECCETITQSDSKQQLCLRRRKDALRDAVRANAIESAAEPIGDDSWVAARTM